MKLARPIWLASASPRRRLMLAEAGIDMRVQPPDLDDASLRPGGVTPEQWVMALAYLKARRVADLIRGWQDRFASWWNPTDDEVASGEMTLGTVLGADTVCVTDKDEILGQPRDADDARRMMQRLRQAEHRTITGVCLFSLHTGTRWMLVDRTAVRVGDISDAEIEAYLASNDWRGKAGAYNLSERLAAGWPIEYHGDPTTVMGLPMRRLTQVLDDRIDA